MQAQSPVMLRARLPAPLLEALDEAAGAAGMTRSAVLRELLAIGLAARGLWPPAGRPPSHPEWALMGTVSPDPAQ